MLWNKLVIKPVFWLAGVWGHSPQEPEDLDLKITKKSINQKEEQ